MKKECTINSTQVKFNFPKCHFNIWVCIARLFPNPPDSPCIVYFTDMDKNNLLERKLL